MGRIIESDMLSMPYRTHERRTTFDRTAADGYHIVPAFAKIFRDVARRMATNIYTHLGHSRDSLRIHTSSRVGSCRKDL